MGSDFDAADEPTAPAAGGFWHRAGRIALEVATAPLPSVALASLVVRAWRAPPRAADRKTKLELRTAAVLDATSRPHLRHEPQETSAVVAAPRRDSRIARDRALAA